MLRRNELNTPRPKSLVWGIKLADAELLTEALLVYQSKVQDEDPYGTLEHKRQRLVLRQICRLNDKLNNLINRRM